MRALLASAVLAATMFVASAAAQTDDPIARARTGQVECYTPDRVARTCRAMSTYRTLQDGRIVNDAIVFLQPSIVMYVSSYVVVRDGMVCGSVTSEDLDGARFEVGGAPATPEQVSAIRAAIEQMFAGIGEICTRYTPGGDMISVTAFVDGVERPDFADQMIWIRPDDGYTMGMAETSAT